MNRIVLILVMLVMSVSIGATGDSAGHLAGDGYLGSERCAGCHQTEHTAWIRSHHDLAMQPATRETVLGDFNHTSFDYFGTKSHFFREGERFFVRTEGADGKPANFPIAYTFGVEPLQQYLIEFPGGRLQALSIVWDTRPAEQGGQRWYHLYPDEAIRAGDELHWTGLNQNWNFMCADCHSTNLQKNYDLKTDTYATTWSDIDVGCEACHGPGRDHVEAMKNGRPQVLNAGFRMSLSRAEEKAWVPDPETGSPRAEAPPTAMQPELQVCAHCHSRRVTQFHGVRPEDGLFQHFMPSLLDQGLYHSDGQIDSEVYVYGSFIQSAMYHAGVTCSDCHDPHSLRVDSDEGAVCAQCHLPTKFNVASHHGHANDSPGAQCVNCHMPAKTYMGVDARRDHSFRIPRPDLSTALGVPNACNDCHSDQSAEWAARVLMELHGEPDKEHFAFALHKGRAGDPAGGQELASLIADVSQPAIARATAVTLLPRYLTPRSAGVLQQVSRSEDPLLALGVAQALRDLPEHYRVIVGLPGLYDEHRVVRSVTASHLPAADVPAKPVELRKRYEQSLADFVLSQENNADRPESLLNLGQHYWQRGQADLAETYYRRAIDIAPWYAPAYVNLAERLRAMGKEEQGRLVLENGLKEIEDSAAIQYSLGLLLVRDKQYEEALSWLKKAADSEPEVDRYVYVYAVALNDRGNTREAIEVLEKGLQKHPNSPQILAALVSFHRVLGNELAAAQYERRLQPVQ